MATPSDVSEAIQRNDSGFAFKSLVGGYRSLSRKIDYQLGLEVAIPKREWRKLPMAETSNPIWESHDSKITSSLAKNGRVLGFLPANQGEVIDRKASQFQKKYWPKNTKTPKAALLTWCFFLFKKHGPTLHTSYTWVAPPHQVAQVSWRSPERPQAATR